MTKSIAAALLCLVFSVPVLSTGCGGPDTIDGVCEAICECQNSCNGNGKKQCEDTFNMQQSQATAAGCDAEFHDLLSCTGNAECKNGVINIDGVCADQAPAFVACLMGKSN